jgi:hypothetical protein
LPWRRRMRVWVVMHPVYLRWLTRNHDARNDYARDHEPQ